LFKTSLVGQPVVVSMDAEVNRFIFQQEGKLFRSWYPETTNTLFGKESMESVDGSIHKYIRTLISRLFGHENLRDVLFAEMEGNIRESLAAWAAEPSVEAMDAVGRVSTIVQARDS
jgi:cytochrome P450